MFYTTSHASPLGTFTLASDGANITGLWLKGQKYYAATMPDNITEKSELPVFTRAREWLEDYFSGKNPAISRLPLDPCGGVFRKAVWDLLCEIPYGHCTTYGELAKKMALRMHKTSMSSQAVGSAVGHNPISIIIPCHRVIGSNGSLTGYAGGIDKKIALLKLEGVNISHLRVPTR